MNVPIETTTVQEALPETLQAALARAEQTIRDMETELHAAMYHGNCAKGHECADKGLRVAQQYWGNR